MSTNYRPLSEIRFDRLFDGCLKKYGCREEIRSGATPDRRYLAGPDGVLIAFRKSDGGSSFSRVGPLPRVVLDAISEEFGVELVCEHDPRYWGFATEEEWDEAWEKLDKGDKDKFYNDLLHYVRGEPNDLSTENIAQADIAKSLIEGNRSLAEPWNRGVLLEWIEAAERLMTRRDDDVPF